VSQGRPSVTVGAVVGFRGEARCLRGLDVEIACSGGSSERARSEAERLVAEGAAALVSFGLAGGLAPGLRPGDLLLPHLVRSTGSASWSVDPVWREQVQARLAAGGVRAQAGAVAGSDRILATAADKRMLFEATGALAVDMESHAVAAIARDAGVPFLVLRALADPFDQTVPQVAREALRPDGRIRIRATYGGLLRQPGQLIELFSLARQSALALGALRRGARLAGAGLGFTPFPE
jgi:adenosylhomocysteine nucleosidase